MRNRVTLADVAKIAGVNPGTVSRSLNPQTENQVIGKIIDIGFLGQKIIYHVELGNKKFVHVTIPTSERSKNPGFILGKTVYLSWYHSEGVILKE